MRALLEQIGRIVRDERLARNTSLTALASSATVQEERLEALEHGQAGMSTVDLDRLAEQLGLDPVALAEGRRIDGGSPAVFLRHSSAFQDFNPADAQVFAWALAQGQCLFSLGDEDVKGRLGELAVEEVIEGPDHAPAKQGHALARLVRGFLGRLEEPLNDLRALLEDRFYVAVLQAPLATKRLAAASVRAPARQGAAVVLNTKDEERRKNPLLDRVHLAHELCHILFDPKENGVQLVLEAEGREDLLEQRARAFAAELLVPSSSLSVALHGRRLATNAAARREAIRLREHFRVPWEVTVQQLKNHGHLSAGLADELLAGGSGRYQRPLTRLPSPGDPSLALCKALERALDEATVTEGQARALLGRAPGDPFPWETRGSAA